MVDMLEILTPRELPQLKYTTDRGTFRLIAPDAFMRRVEDNFAEASRRDLVRQPPSVVVKPDTHSLAASQTILRDQGLRGTCFAFSVIAAMEALYRRVHGRVLDLSEHYLFHRSKYSELYGDYATSQTAWENNSSYWDGQGAGGLVFWLQRFGVPEEGDCRYLSQAELEALRLATPAAGALDGKPGMTQENIDAFELTEALIPRVARMRARYRVRKAFALTRGASPEVIENTLLANHEVIADVAWNPVWNATKNAFDYGGSSIGGHSVLIVGYERTARVFLVKNSHNDGRLLRMSYDYFTAQSPGYHYITEVSHPDEPADDEAPWLGAHPSEIGGAGTLVIRRTVNLRADDPTAPTKLGELYQNGQGRDVNGSLIDGGRGAIFHVAETTARVKPGAASGTRHVVGEQGDWRWCCKCQSLHYTGNSMPTACAAGGAHDSAGSGWYALPYTFSRFGGQPGWAWCHKCQTLYYGRHSGGRCPRDGGKHDSHGSSNYILGWEGSPRNFVGQAGWRWCNKCDALFFSGGGATRCPAGGAHDLQGSGAYYLRHTGPLPWQRFAGALRRISVGVDGTVVGVDAAGGVFRRSGAGWQQLPGALVQISAGDAANIWGVNAAQQIFRWNGAAWQRIDGALTWVSAAADGAVWGINASDQIFRWHGSGWTPVPGGLRQIAVASASLVFGVAGGGEVFRRVGDAWERLPGVLRQLSVAADGSVWGVGTDDAIFRWHGSDWDRLNGSLRQVAHRSRERAWGVSGIDEIWHTDP